MLITTGACFCCRLLLLHHRADRQQQELCGLDEPARAPDTPALRRPCRRRPGNARQPVALHCPASWPGGRAKCTAVRMEDQKHVARKTAGRPRGRACENAAGSGQVDAEQHNPEQRHAAPAFGSRITRLRYHRPTRANCKFDYCVMPLIVEHVMNYTIE